MPKLEFLKNILIKGFSENRILSKTQCLHLRAIVSGPLQTRVDVAALVRLGEASPLREIGSGSLQTQGDAILYSWFNFYRFLHSHDS